MINHNENDNKNKKLIKWIDINWPRPRHGHKYT